MTTKPIISPKPLNLGVVFFPTWTNPYPSLQLAEVIANPAASFGVVFIKWSDVDNGNGKYDWSIPDAQIAPWLKAGKKVAIDLWPISPTVDPTCGPNAKSGSMNCSVPNYVWQQLGPQNAVMCTGGNGTQLIPNYLHPVWRKAWFNFLTAAYNHYAIMAIYIHGNIGLEDSPTQGNWTNPSNRCGAAFAKWGLTPQAWQSFTEAQLLHEKEISTGPCKFIVPLTNQPPMTPPLADTIAGVAASYGIGLGTQALSSWDLTENPAYIAWLRNMQVYPNVIHQLQTNKASNPNCPQPWNNCPGQMGPLGPILDFAQKNVPGAYVEIYYQDWLIPQYQANFKQLAGK